MISVRLLGPLEVIAQGQVVEIPGLRSKAVLARLAIDAGRIVSVDRLVDDVWGDETPANALNALQARISQLRTAIGRDVIKATRPGYVLAIDPAAVDSVAFEAAVVSARRLVDSDPQAAAVGFENALESWRGDAFGGLGDPPFALVAALRLEELRLGAMEDQLRIEVAAGRVAQRLPQLEHLATLHPLREPVHELLIRAYAAVGRQADALGAYRRVRQRLVEELGIDPGRRLQELEAGVLRQDPSLVVQTVTETSQRPSVEIGRSPEVGNLARPLSRIFHRQVDLKAVQGLLVDHRLVTITGSAGVGKSRLAIELASLALTRAHGVWFVGLESTDEAELVADSMAAAIGAPLEQPFAGLLSRLRGSDTLIVVDNCEHLGDGPANVIRGLLEHCPKLTVLATSQRPLGVPGEMVWPLEPLERAEAVELFAYRVGELNPRIVFDEPQLQAANTICESLDDLPLAIELAARRCGVLGVEEVAERLRDRFDLLADRGSARPERHQTLANAIGWSYGLLFPDTQLLLQLIANFPDGATTEALEDVGPAVGLPADEILDLLTQLVDRSLIVADRGGANLRFRMLNSIRAFAVDRSALELRTEAIQAAIAAWLTRLAKRCAAGMRTPDQARCLATLREERVTLNAGFEWLVVHDPTVALQFVNHLYLGWLISGDTSAAELRLGRALQAASEAALPLRCRVSACRAVILARIGRHEEAAPLAAWAFANLEGTTDHGVAVVYGMIGQVHSLAGRFDEGLEILGIARQSHAAAGDAWAEAICALNMALALGRLGDYVQQEQLTREVVSLLQLHNDAFVRRMAHRNLALAQVRNGAYDEALVNLSAALEAEQSIGFRAEEAGTLRLVARVQHLIGHREQAMQLLRDCISTGQQLGDALSTELALADLVALCRATGEVAQARQLLDQFGVGVSSFGLELVPIALQVQIGALALERGDALGREVVVAAVGRSIEVGDNHQRVLGLDLLARYEPDAVVAAAQRVEAEELALTTGVHRAERPDRGPNTLVG